ncbi:6-hydroxymethylpterin diphosphokinase MptE-like protein [Thermogladius calderae]|uniref:6-hydroxymethylpterin diphosphokinase MptE-like protein n=1 Tax=Thermogladius calderae TaxID=1200300 RepID=UPI00064F371A|nr:6-hydroxymethylpterin diphosphokinase MptE-like protein [Thermogladius calderae]
MTWVVDRSEWTVLYSVIKSKLPLSFDRDQYATDVLSGLISAHKGKTTLEQLPRLMGSVVVFGCGKNLEKDVRLYIEKYSHLPVIAADGSTRYLLEEGVQPLIVVTDLDGDVRYINAAAQRGSIVVVHAHGDNVERLRAVVPRLDGMLIGSTQVEPRPFVYNFGGFTDGDRSVFLARALGSSRVILAGFDLDTPHYCPSDIVKDLGVKKLKLEVARMLLKYLEGKGVRVEFIQ